MNFQELLERKKTLDMLLDVCGYSADIGRNLSRFHQLMQERYTVEEVRNPSFGDREVPPDVIDAFRPLYEVLRQNSHEELPPL
jgi:hypothetical protein